MVLVCIFGIAVITLLAVLEMRSLKISMHNQAMQYLAQLREQNEAQLREIKRALSEITKTNS
jgi:chaperonin cofactor prefoldin